MAGGRPKGATNVLGRGARARILEAFDKMGGVDALVEWGKEHQTEFYLGLFRVLLPRNPQEVPEQLQLQQQTVSINAVQVADPREALNALERMEDERYAAEAERRAEVLRAIREAGAEAAALEHLHATDESTAGGPDLPEGDAEGAAGAGGEGGEAGAEADA